MVQCKTWLNFSVRTTLGYQVLTYPVSDGALCILQKYHINYKIQVL